MLSEALWHNSTNICPALLPLPRPRLSRTFTLHKLNTNIPPQAGYVSFYFPPPNFAYEKDLNMLLARETFLEITIHARKSGPSTTTITTTHVSRMLLLPTFYGMLPQACPATHEYFITAAMSDIQVNA